MNSPDTHEHAPTREHFSQPAQPTIGKLRELQCVRKGACMRDLTLNAYEVCQLAEGWDAQ